MPDSKVEVKDMSNEEMDKKLRIACGVLWEIIADHRDGRINNPLEMAKKALIEIGQVKDTRSSIANNGVSVDWVKTEEHIHALISINDDSISAAKQVCEYLKAKLPTTAPRGEGEKIVQDIKHNPKVMAILERYAHGIYKKLTEGEVSGG